jgi:DNA-binding GntR family transcriptional regulator
MLAAYEFREVVDGLATRLAAPRGDDELPSTLAGCIGAQRRALELWKSEDYTAANVRFHTTIFEASGNDHVVSQLRIVCMTAQVFTPVELVSRKRAESGVAEHQKILDAVRAGDGEEAERVARAHIRRTIETLPAAW